ncbi:hypothetical protein RHS01_00072 [Rhizoctonia solani]|uniref:Uncharacterized protein n=1 Tax=Rhizoctonia solani TaxID=456999 RepID=A0A8H7IMC7_9AGAM|nr:hypothetical protein RHS01_00072 [Rhizoctonia solani]
MSNYTWYVFVDDLSLWLQTNLKDGHQPDWNEFLNVVRPAKALLSDRAHNAVEKFGEVALSVQDHWNFVNDENRMTPRASEHNTCLANGVLYIFVRTDDPAAQERCHEGRYRCLCPINALRRVYPRWKHFCTMTTIGTLGRESPLAIAGATAVASAIAGGMYLATN